MNALLLLLLGCTGAPTPPQEPPPVAPPAPETDEAPRPSPFTAARVRACGGTVVEGEAPRVLTLHGALPREEAPSEEVLAGLPPGEPVDFPKPPANAAATVERASWRLAELLGPREGLVPGGLDESDPALHQGIRVRSARKTRRHGPPMLVVVGDRGARLVIALMDKEAGEVYDADVIETPVTRWERAGATPLWDLDSDGSRELLLWADAPQHYLRYGYAVDETGPPHLVRVLTVEGEPLACP